MLKTFYWVLGFKVASEAFDNKNSKIKHMAYNFPNKGKNSGKIYSQKIFENLLNKLPFLYFSFIFYPNCYSSYDFSSLSICQLKKIKIKVNKPFSSSADHLSRTEDECGCSWFTYPHYDGSKTLGGERQEIY